MGVLRMLWDGLRKVAAERGWYLHARGKWERNGVWEGRAGIRDCGNARGVGVVTVAYDRTDFCNFGFRVRRVHDYPGHTAHLFHVALPFFSVWLNAGDGEGEEGHVLGVRFYRYRETGEYMLTWEAGPRDGYTLWDASWPWWYQKAVNLTDLVLGEQKHRETRVGEPVEVLVAMPERHYRWRFQRVLDVWERPRKPGAIVRLTWSAEPVSSGEGIPFPGKGENAWDCGMDAMMGFSVPGPGIVEAIEQVKARAQERRKERGFSAAAAIAYEAERKKVKDELEGHDA